MLERARGLIQIAVVIVVWPSAFVVGAVGEPVSGLVFLPLRRSSSVAVLVLAAVPRGQESLASVPVVVALHVYAAVRLVVSLLVPPVSAVEAFLPPVFSFPIAPASSRRASPSR